MTEQLSLTHSWWWKHQILATRPVVSDQGLAFSFAEKNSHEDEDSEASQVLY